MTLNKFTSPMVIDYLSWARNNGYASVPKSLTYLTTFFNWLICDGRREIANPIMPWFHMPPKVTRKPRPLTTEEVDMTWQILRERGCARLRFAVAISLEAGLRAGELCNLRIGDVNLSQQTAFIRLPNKTKTEREACFGDDTKKYFLEWMAERHPLCEHDHVLHNTRNSNPMSTPSLIRHYNRVLRKELNGKKINETGWDEWSGHRMRHTMATNLAAGGADASTLMRLAGWRHPDSAPGYVKVDDEQTRHGYTRAMEEARKLKAIEPRRKTLTFADVLNRKRNVSVQALRNEDLEHCV